MSHPSSRREFLVGGLAAQAAAPKAPVPLRYRILGKTGLRVTEVGCGCEAVSDVTVLQRALDLGINFFDTARAYEGGNNERVLRAALGTRRKDVFVSTRSYGENARTLRAHLDDSLRELGTDYVDIWYMGSKDDPKSVTDDMLEVQLAAQKAGKLRFRGVSTHRLHRMLPFIVKRGRFDVVQTPYSFAVGTARDPMKVDATDLDAALDQLKQAGIGVVAMKVMLGVVARKTMAGGYRGRPPADALSSPRQQPTAYVAALRWALRSDRIQTTSVRMADRDQLEENVRAMAAPFSEEDRRLLSRRFEEIRPLVCRMCGACDGACPKGLPVSDLVRSVTYAEGYGVYAMGRERFDRLPPVVRQVRCADCSTCAVRCPNGLRVAERVQRAQELYC